MRTLLISEVVAVPVLVMVTSVKLLLALGVSAKPDKITFVVLRFTEPATGEPELEMITCCATTVI